MRRKFYYFLTVFAALLFALPASATWEFVGGDDATATPAASLAVGKLYVIEGAASSSTLGHYLNSGGNGLVTSIDSSCVWTLEDAGTNATTGEQQYYVRTLKGLYLGASFKTTSDKSAALAILFHSCTNGTVGDLDFGSSGSGTSWDANSSTIATLSGTTVTFLQNDDSWSWLTGGIDVNATTSKSKNQWDIREVEWTVNLAADLQEIITNVDNAGYLNYAHSAVNPYQVTDSVFTALQTAYNNALTAVGETHTNDEFQAYIDALNGAIAAFTNTDNIVPMKDGYYYIRTASTNYQASEGIGLYASSGSILWGAATAQDSAFSIWHFTTADDGYTVQNMGDASYIYGSTGNDDATRLLTTTTSAQRTVGITYRGRSQISLQANGYSGSMRYFNMNNANGTNKSGQASVATYSAGSTASWYLVPVTDEALIARLESELSQKALNAELQALISEAGTLVYGNQGKLSPTGEKLVTAASQISTNNPEQSEGTTANGGGYEGLLDGDLTTYYHAAWTSSSETDRNYNYIQVHLESGLPTNVAIWWARRITNNNNRPISLLIQTSTDGTTWSEGQTLSNPEGRFPTAATDTFYTSPNITLPEGQTYLRLSVLHTSPSDRCVVQPYPYFTMSEFNLYPGSATSSDPSETQAARPEVAPLYEALVSAYNAAKNVTTATQTDVEALQSAINAFSAVLADTTQIIDALASANSAIAKAEVGTEVGQFSAASVEALDAVVGQVSEAAPYYNLTAVEVDSLAQLVTKALATFNASINLPADGVYYVVSNVSETNRPEASNPTRGRIMYARSTSQTSYVYWAGTPEDYTDASAGWYFKSLGDGTFTVQSVVSGAYWGAPENLGMLTLQSEPVPYSIVSLGDGEYGFRPAAGGLLLDAYWWNRGVFAYEGEGTSAGSPTSWKVQAVSDEFNDQRTFAANRSYVVTLPYSTYELPLDVNGQAEVKFYDVTGAVKTGEAVTAIQLTQLQTGLTAGKPVVMTVSLPDSANVTLSMQLDLENFVLTNVAATANGLHGTFGTISLDTAGYAYFVATTDTLQTTSDTTSVSIARQQGFVAPVEVQTVEGAAADLIVPIAGDGVVNAIRSAKTSDARATVNVYSIDGVLVRKQVQAGVATQGLAKGLYIVGGEKVLVK